MPGCRRYLGSLVLTLAACSAPDPQTALERLLEEAERAAEARDTGYFRDVVSEDYRDAGGNDKDRLIAMIRGYFLAHQSVEVLLRLQALELRGDDAAEAVLTAGILSRSGGGPIGGFEGRLHRLELELVEVDGDWQLIGARWEGTPETLAGE
jgi:hypothetical protein